MKKQLLSVLSFLMLCIGLQAQTNIANYTFATSSGTFVPLTGATTFTTSWDSEVATNIPLGGSFTYGAATFTSCNVFANGFISFGGAVSVTTPLSSGTFSGAVSAFGQDGANSTAVGATPSISYMNIGGAAGEFVIQYTDHANFANRINERLNFQIRLNLATGGINIVYGSWSVLGTTGTTALIGIRGNTTTWSSNVNSLNTVNLPVGTSCSWTDAITSVANNSSMYSNPTNTLIAPSNGLTYSWNPPVNPTLAPVRSFGAVSGITSTNAVISWTVPTSATQFNVQYRIPGTCSWTNFVGNPVSVNTATLTGLNFSTVYQIRVQSSDGTNNAIWSHIPNLAGTGGGYNTAAGTFSTLGIPVDLQALQITSPAVITTGCYGTHTVTIRIKNAGTSVLDFSTNNATINASVSGPNPMSFSPVVINTGTLAAGTGTMDVVVSTSYNMSAIGVYTFNANSILATPDLNTANDAISPTTFTTSGPSTLPQLVNFNGYTGTPTSLATNFPGWTEGSGVVIPNIGGNGDFLTSSAAQTTFYSVAAKMNLYNLLSGWIISPRVVPTAAHVFKYKASLVNYNTTTAANFGLNDTVKAMISTNCGLTWTALRTFNSTTNQGLDNTTNVLREYTESLAAYAGQEIIVAIYARRAPTGTVPDIDILIDDLQIDLPPACSMPTSLNTSTILPTSANFTWTAGGTETAWDIYYGAQPLTVPTATTAPTATSSVASYSATGLTQFTGYSVYVRANCGAGNTSIWTAVKNFTTPVSCPAPSTVTISGITSSTANATWLAGGTETSWLVNYMTPTTTVITASPAYSLTGLNPSTTYSIQVKGICAVGDSSTWTTFTTFMTPCLPPSILTTTPSARCGSGTTTLSATGDVGATLNWYANSTGGISVGTGTLFTTPTITTTTDFYVSAMGGLVTENVGRVSAASATGFLTTPNWGIVFNTTKNVLVNTATIYPIGTGSVTIALLNASGVELAVTAPLAVTGTGTNSPVVVNLGFNVPTGINFKIVLKAYTGITDLIRDGSGNVFPYTSASNALSVTGGWNGTGSSASYYWFYNLNISTGCESIRTAVTASVTAPPALSVTSGSTICANAIQTLSVTSTLSDFDNYVWTPSTNLFTDGSATTAYTGNNQSILYYSSPLNNSTTYTLTANNTSNGCANNTTVSMGASMPVIYASANPTLLCSGSTVSLTANTDIIAAGSANIGSGNLVTVNSNISSGNYVSPYSHYYGGYKSQYIIRASELQSAGVSSGNITSLSFDVTTAGTTYTDFAISMAATTQSIATTAFNGAVSQVYGPSNVTPIVGLNTYTFSTPFNWDGVSNITIQICWSNNNAGGGGAAEIKYNTTTFASTSYYRVDNQTSAFVCGQATATSITSNRPLLVLSGQTVSQGMGTVTWQWNPGAINTNTAAVTPMNTGSTTSTESYTVTALDPATTCTNSAIVNISVLPIPSVTATASSASICAGSTATLTATGATNYTWTSGGTASTEVVSPSSSSVFTVTGETSGCANTATVALGVNSIPTITATASSASVCAGSSATLTASGATNYTWTSGGTASTEVVTPGSASVYTVTGETSGCSNSATVALGVNALPSVTAITSNSLICYNLGESATLTASTSATSYTWSDGANTMTTTVTPTVGTTYTLTVNDGICDASTTVFVDAQVCMGVTTIAPSANGINVYPNPTNGILNISISSALDGITSIEVYDAIGKLTIKENLTSNTTIINTSKLEDGIYVFKIINSNKAIKIGKIVKQ